ncbi:hypothetical protein [Vibrio harveyi]|uniref:hypothetical protein n=1 Tax=Vibrio harveyi TaxID=669 RepID=UPI003CF90467
MKIFLEYGISPDNKPVHISEVPSGSTDLKCPFCPSLLTANKGSINAHHFHHKERTCKLSKDYSSSLPGWHHFDFHLPKSVTKRLLDSNRMTGSNRDYYGRKSDIMEKYELVTKSTGYLPKLTPKALVVCATYSLAEFSVWMRNSMKERYSALKLYDAEQRVNALLIEGCRQHSLYESSLYLFQFKIDGEAIYKIGRTTREPSTRLREVITMLEHEYSREVIGKILCVVPSAGYVEKYALYKYREYHYPVGSFTEFLSMPDSSLSNLEWHLNDLKKHIAQTELTTHDKMILSGRWEYEPKRLYRSNIGIQKAKARGAIGRPKGTNLNEEEFLSKHQDIIDLLPNSSITEVMDATGKSRATIYRVKKALSA